MKKIPTVHELRKKGFKVRVTHVRKFFRFDPKTGKKTEFFAPFQSSKARKRSLNQTEVSPNQSIAPFFDAPAEEFFLSPKGGETIIEIANSMRREIGKGVVRCSDDDVYVKSFGVKKAIAIAVNNVELEGDPYSHIRKLLRKK